MNHILLRRRKKKVIGIFDDLRDKGYTKEYYRYNAIGDPIEKVTQYPNGTETRTML